MTTPALTTYPLSDIIAEARDHCPFYRRLYAGLGETPALTDLPVIEPEAYWKAHGEDQGEVLTGPLVNGIVLSSGGTTGAPKFSYYNNEEWDSVVALSALACENTGLEDGDRVANLFASGNLSSSLILFTQSLKAMRARVLQFPLGHSPEGFAGAAAIIRRFGINTLASFPTRLLRLIEHLDQEDAPRIELRRILFAGELFSADQQAFLQKRFPGISIRSVGYASVDAGMIGYADAACTLGQHRAFAGATQVEIVPEDTDQPTEEAGQPGRIIFTSLTRRLMPLLRYPSGDLGAWVDDPGTPARRFVLLGRAEEAARVASYTVPVSGVRALLEAFHETLDIKGFQLLVTRENLRDRLTLRVASGAGPEALMSRASEIRRALDKNHPLLAEATAGGIIHPVQIEWTSLENLIVGERTGKLRLVVDRRAG